MSAADELVEVDDGRPAVGDQRRARAASSPGRVSSRTKQGKRPWVEQVLEEREQALVGVLRVVDDQDDGSPSPPTRREEGGPGGEEVLPGEGPAPPMPSRTLEPRARSRRAPPRRGRSVRSAALELGGDVSRRCVRRGQRSQPAADGLGERVVGHALAVGDAAAAVPADGGAAGRRRTSRTPRPAGSCRRPASPSTTRRAGRPDSSTRWKSSLTRRSSRSRPTSGASRPSARWAPPTAATTARTDHSGTGSALPLSACAARVDVGDRRRGQQPRRLVDPHLTGRRAPTARAPRC